MANLNFIQEVRDADITAAMEREIRLGWQMRQDLRDGRLEQARREAAQHDKNKTAGALGKPVLSVPEAEFFDIRREYGEECWDDKGFIRDYGRLVPGSRIARV